MIDDVVGTVNVSIPIGINGVSTALLSGHGEVNLEFKVPLQDMTPLVTYGSPPITYSVQSITSIKEQRIRLTAPMFCSLVPHIDNFTAYSDTSITGLLQTVNGVG